MSAGMDAIRLTPRFLPLTIVFRGEEPCVLLLEIGDVELIVPANRSHLFAGEQARAVIFNKNNLHWAVRESVEEIREMLGELVTATTRPPRVEPTKRERARWRWRRLRRRLAGPLHWIARLAQRGAEIVEG